jgi:energy-coupling factor transporter transmembrane protein EcfT
MKKIKLPTVLTTASIFWFIFLIILYFLINDSSNHKFLAFIGLFIVGIICLLIDLFLRKYIKKRKIVNIIGFILVVFLVLWFVNGMINR